MYISNIFLFAKPKTKVKILEGFWAWKTLTNYFRKPIHWALKKKKEKKSLAMTGYRCH